MRSLIAFFSQMCSKSVRDKFLRLSQIASLLQLYDVSENPKRYVIQEDI